MYHYIVLMELMLCAPTCIILVVQLSPHSCRLLFPNLYIHSAGDEAEVELLAGVIPNLRARKLSSQLNENDENDPMMNEKQRHFDTEFIRHAYRRH